MPELPEVEIVKEGLKKVFKPNVFIKDISFLRKNLRSSLPLKKKKKILKQIPKSVQRRAKYILVEFTDFWMISHLGMTGAWRVETNLQKVKTHDHVILHLSSDELLIYSDPRRFGVFDIIEKNKFLNDKRFKTLGPEPLSDEFNVEFFFKISRGKKTTVKQFVMDQKNVVGIGNIYACEALFEACVSPLKQARKLTKNQIEKIIAASQRILEQSILYGGSSINDYKDIDEKKGSFQTIHKVYGRKGEPCVKCGTTVRAKVISGRNSFWCSKCQKS